MGFKQQLTGCSSWKSKTTLLKSCRGLKKSWILADSLHGGRAVSPSAECRRRSARRCPPLGPLDSPGTRHAAAGSPPLEASWSARCHVTPGRGQAAFYSPVLSGEAASDSTPQETDTDSHCPHRAVTKFFKANTFSWYFGPIFRIFTSLPLSAQKLFSVFPLTYLWLGGKAVETGFMWASHKIWIGIWTE